MRPVTTCMCRHETARDVLRPGACTAIRDDPSGTGGSGHPRSQSCPRAIPHRTGRSLDHTEGALDARHHPGPMAFRVDDDGLLAGSTNAQQSKRVSGLRFHLRGNSRWGRSEEMTIGACSIAAPIRAADGHVIAALGVASSTAGIRLFCSPGARIGVTDGDERAVARRPRCRDRRPPGSAAPGAEVTRIGRGPPVRASQPKCSTRATCVWFGCLSGDIRDLNGRTEVAGAGGPNSGRVNNTCAG